MERMKPISKVDRGAVTGSENMASDNCYRWKEDRRRLERSYH